jgi:hypothetical protein
MAARTAGPIHPYAKQSAAFGIIVGVAIILIWLYRILTGGVPELWDSMLQTKLHVLIQLLTGLFLIVSGWALWTGKSWAFKAFILANGMLIIAVINAVSWYGDRGEMGFVLFFVAVAIAAVFFVMRAEE